MRTRLDFLMWHEWRVLTDAAIVRATMAVFVAALVSATALGVSRVKREYVSVDRFDARTVEQLAKGRQDAAGAVPDAGTVPPRGPLHPDTVANERGLLAMVPPAPLSAFAVGQSDVYPSYLKVTARSLDSLVTGDQIEHPLAVANGQIDLAFVVLFLYPLLIFAVSFDLTASERENGMLRMVLSHPVRMLDLVAGKLLARILLLSAPVILVPGAVLLFSGLPIDRIAGARFVLWTAAVLAYGLVWHGIALIVNARGRSAPANALALAGIWLVFSVVGPSCVNLLIAVAYPMPSRVESAVQARRATQQAAVQGSRQLGQFLEDHPTTANVGREGMKQFALLQAARDREVASRLQAVNDTFEQQLNRQRAAASWLGLLSPTMVAQLALLDIAGTGSARYEHFRREAAAFQARWQAFFEPRVLEVSQMTAADYDRMPRFYYRDEPLRVALARVAPRLMLLAAAAFACVSWGLHCYRTCDA